MKRLLVVVALLTLAVGMSGCGVKYCHSSKSAYDFERDKYDCEGESYARTNNCGLRGNPFAIVDEMRKCLTVKHGWYRCQ